jgi:hypothetical protein
LAAIPFLIERGKAHRHAQVLEAFRNWIMFLISDISQIAFNVEGGEHAPGPWYFSQQNFGHFQGI